MLQNRGTLKPRNFLLKIKVLSESFGGSDFFLNKFFLFDKKTFIFSFFTRKFCNFVGIFPELL